MHADANCNYSSKRYIIVFVCPIYRCNHKFKGEEKCSTPKLEEEQIKELFIKAVNLLLADAGEIIRNYYEVRPLIFDTECFATELAELQEELTVTAELI